MECPTIVAVLLTVFSIVTAIPRQSLYDYGFNSDLYLPQEDEISSPETPLSVPFVFYGEKYTSIFVNANGLLSFQTEIPMFFNIQFPLNYAVIAPFYSNVDIRASGKVSYGETQNPEILAKVNKNIRENFSKGSHFEARSVFIATWASVGYHDLKADKVNTFQVAIASDGEDSYVEFLYPEGGIQWIQGTGAVSGLPDARAQAGLISSNGTLFTLKGSGTDLAQTFDRRSNMNSPGHWIFHVGKVSKIEQPDINGHSGDAQEQQIGTCLDGQSICHSQSKCIDYKDGFCCVCQNNYYGNGKTCIKNDVPMRVNGKVNGVLNGIRLEQLDLQSYIVMPDGRSYTAISKLPHEIGHSAQTLQILGSLIGFLFAKPVNDVKNGYQITGGILNHSAVITFHQTNEKIQITQTYFGLDVYDQLRLEINVHGNVPNIPKDSNFILPNYDEQISSVRPGVLTSHMTHEYQYGKPAVMEQYTIEQTIEYKPCMFEPPSENPTWKHKVFKNFITYEEREQILRFAMSSKVTPLEDVDPCKEGRQHCGPDKTCIVEGDTYRCVCNPGYQYIEYNEQDGAICVDINECQVGLHNCDINAQCVNEPGRFTCRCNPGFEGDGFYCRNLRTCDDIECPENAECIEDDDVRCTCSYGFIGDGRICVADKRITCDVVNNCSPYASCDVRESRRAPECQCLSGYDGNGYICQRSQEDSREYTQPPVTTTVKYVEPENEESCNKINNCHPNAQCIFSHSGNYQCRCNAGYEGDGYDCIVTDVSCLEIDVCNTHASCVYNENLSKSICVCDPGYQGDGFFCEPIAQCRAHTDCKENEYCSLSLSEYKCICIDGYVKDAEDICRKLEGSCGGGTCVENAQCLFDQDYQTYYCQCDPEFRGDGITECKPRPLGCDETNNCGLHANCIYDRTDSDYKCQCDDGFYGDGYLCTSQKTCHIDPYLCDVHASCVMNNDRQHICECNDGYTGNGSVCKISPKHEGNFLLLNQGMATLSVPFNPTPKNPGKPIQIQYYQMAIGLDIDCYEGRVYWSDITGKALKSSAYNGTNYTDFLTTDIGTPEGLSIDWVSRNIYWTDSFKGTLEVANLETKLRKTLFSDNLVNPRGIAVHPQRGKVFWSDWNRRGPKIEWANMDGTDREIFLEGSNVQLPNSIAIDWETDQVCFADAGTKNIDCINIDTREVRTIVTNCTYPFGLAISENHFYWTDWVSQKIESVLRHTLIREPSMKVPLGGSGNKLYGMAAVPEQCPGLINACQFYSGRCAHGNICLPNGMGTRSCVCADNQNCHNN